MHIEQHKEEVIFCLRSAARGKLLDEEKVWDLVRQAVIAAEQTEAAGRLDRYIYSLGLIFVRETGTLPGHSKGDNETRFERFVHAIPPPAGTSMTRYSVKSAIKRLRENPHFTGTIKTPTAAE